MNGNPQHQAKDDYVMPAHLMPELLHLAEKPIKIDAMWMDHGAEFSVMAGWPNGLWHIVRHNIPADAVTDNLLVEAAKALGAWHRAKAASDAGQA